VKVTRGAWAAAIGVVAIATVIVLISRPRTADGYTFTVAAGENPSSLKLTFPAATMIEIDRDGRLVIRNSDRSLRIARAHASQDGRPIDVRLMLDRDGDVRFVLGRFDPERPLIVTVR